MFIAFILIALVVGLVALVARRPGVDEGLHKEAARFGAKPKNAVRYDSDKAVAGMVDMRRREAQRWARARAARSKGVTGKVTPINRKAVGQ